jgi:hypothetical protein
MSTAIELKEQIKALKEQQKSVEKAFAKKQKDYKIMDMIMTENRVFLYVWLSKNDYKSFEELIGNKHWDNKAFNKVEYEFMFKQLGYTDEEFFRTFMSWTPDIFNLEFEDRKCGVCLEYYNDKQTPRQFANCPHYCCLPCYKRLPIIGRYKCCVICRASEKPK